MTTSETEAYVGLDRVLGVCAAASGLRDLKPGFAWSERHDRLLALGWPHVRVLSEEAIDPAEIDREMHAVTEKRYPALRLVWPRRLVHRLLRLWATPQNAPLSEAIQNVRKDDGPIGEEEARILAPKIARFGPPGVFDEVEDDVLFFEACVGPSLASTLIVEALESTPDDMWSAAVALRYANAQALGYVLLRAPALLDGQLRDRLETLWQRHREPRSKSALTRGLDVILHGAEGAERSGHRLGGTNALNPRFCTLVRNDPDFVMRVAQADLASKPEPEDRYHAALAFAGGLPVVDAYARSWAGHRDRAAQAYFIETFGEIRSPEVVKAITAMSTTSKAKKEAQRWLDGHVQPS